MRWIISIPLLLLLSGCADTGYYWHNANGHLAVMNQRTDIDELLADDQLDPELRKRLQLVQEIRRFSIEQLDLPANGSYANYVELDRPYVVQNIFAAPEFSMEPKRWWYPAVGKLSYRGFFSEKAADRLAGNLRKRHFDVFVAGVDAYSTLGWLNDPVLSTNMLIANIARQ